MWQLSMSVVPHSPSASQSSPHATSWVSQLIKSASDGHSEASTGTKSQPHGWKVGRGVGAEVVGIAVVGAGVGREVGAGDGIAVVGAGVGQEDGTGEGTAVVGAGVGTGLGTGVGTEVGTNVGANVGSDDGTGVGTGTGADDGAAVVGIGVGKGETDGGAVVGITLGEYVVGMEVGAFGSKKR